jgi:4-amino-4-deoxy-L-arabinose transferase-like glycosyltransferase
MRPAPAWLRLLVRARPWLLALWLPGAHAGWYRTDTHYYAAIAKQAIDAAIESDSLTPLFDLKAGDQPYWNKPPLVFIIEGATIKLLGLSLWSVRLPSLLAAAALVIAAAGVARRLAGARMGVLAGLVGATTLEVFRYTRAVSLDLWLAALVMLAVWCVVRGVRRGPEARAPGTGWVLLAGVPLGLALLTKPLVALLSVPVLMAWAVLIGERRLLAPLLGAGVIAAAIATPWHVFMLVSHPGFAGVYFGEQSLQRVTSGMSDAIGAGPWWYYLGVIGESYWPWLATLVVGLIIWARRGASGADRRALLLSMVWCGAWLVLLSLSAGKYSRYLLPVWPLLGFVSAWLLARSPSRGAARRASRTVVLWLGPGALLAGVLAAGLFPDRLIHAPRDRVWDDARAVIGARPDLPVLCTPAAHPMAANLVMLGHPWPATLTTVPDTPFLLLSSPRHEPTPRGIVLTESADVRLLLVTPE